MQAQRLRLLRQLLPGDEIELAEVLPEFESNTSQTKRPLRIMLSLLPWTLRGMLLQPWVRSSAYAGGLVYGFH